MNLRSIFKGNFLNKKILSSTFEYQLLMNFRRTCATTIGEKDYVEDENSYGTRIGEKDYVEGEKPVDLFRVAIRPFSNYSKSRKAITYKFLNKGGIFWSFDKNKFSSEYLQADFYLWFYLLKEFSEKEDSIIENMRKMTRVEKEDFYTGCFSPEALFRDDYIWSLYSKKKEGHVLTVDDSILSFAGQLAEFLELFYLQIAQEESQPPRWVYLSILEEFLGPNLDVFLFLIRNQENFYRLHLLIKIGFEYAFWLSLGRNLVKHTEDFDGIQVEKALNYHSNFDELNVKIGKLTNEKFKDIKEVKYPRIFLLKRIENLLNKVQQGLNYPPKVKEAIEENAILPRMYPFPGTKNIFPRIKKTTIIELEEEQPDEVKEVRKDKIDLKGLINEEELKKQLKKLQKYFYSNDKVREKYIKTILGIIFRQYLQEIVVSQLLAEKYTWYVNVRKNHLEFAYRNKLEEVEKMTKEEKEGMLRKQEDTTGTIGIEGIVKKPIPNITELIAERKALYLLWEFEEEMVKIYDLAFFLGVYKSLFLFAREIEEKEFGVTNWHEPTKEEQNLGLKSKFARKDELTYVRENISVPFFWILNDLTISRNFDIKIEGKEEFATGVDEIPESGILKGAVYKWRDERGIELERKQEIIWDVREILREAF